LTGRVAVLVVRGGRLEIRLAYDPYTQERLRLAVGARWSPEAKTWWAQPFMRDAVRATLEGCGYQVVDTDRPAPRAVSVAGAVDLVLNAVSSARRSRLARALAVAAHADGDGADRPPAADELVRVATGHLRDGS